jgi:hypothetical protein
MKNYFPFQLIRDLATWWRAVGVGAQGCTDGGLAGYFRPLQVLSQLDGIMSLRLSGLGSTTRGTTFRPLTMQSKPDLLISKDTVRAVDGRGAPQELFHADGP